MHDSLISLFEHRVNLSGSTPALRHKQDASWVRVSWRAWWETSERLAAALIALGLSPGDRVALISATRIEWIWSDVAIMMAGGVVVPIYPSAMPAQVTQILENCAATHVIVENPEQLQKIIPLVQAPDSPIVSVIYMDPDALLETPDASGRLRIKLSDVAGAQQLLQDKILHRFDAFMAMGRRGLAREAECVAHRRRALRAHDLATLVYTSGTLGEPKGVELTHANLLAEVDALSELEIFSEDDVQLLSLPLAHIFARVTLWGAISYGFETAVGEHIKHMMRNLAEVSPTVFAGVPHIYENIHWRLLSQLESGGQDLTARAMAGLLEQSRQISQAQQRGEPPSLGQRAALKLIEPLLYQRVRRLFGGRPRLLISGGAPLSPQVAEFLHACGVLIIEGYGLTETCAAITVNTPEDFRFGSVGRPLPGVDITIAEDGEILVRGGMCARGYFRSPEASHALTDEEGWLHTGDLGRFDRDGYLYINGRSRNIIITAGGKNVAPLVIERHLETSLYVSHAILFGDRRHYLTALLTLDRASVESWAREHAVASESWVELASSPQVRELIEAHVDSVNERHSSFEAVRKFAILDADFSLEQGELTPTLKLKRATVEARYRHIIEDLYEHPYEPEAQ